MPHFDRGARQLGEQKLAHRRFLVRFMPQLPQRGKRLAQIAIQQPRFVRLERGEHRRGSAFRRGSPAPNRRGDNLAPERFTFQRRRDSLGDFLIPVLAECANRRGDNRRVRFARRYLQRRFAPQGGSACRWR